jgi:hypothetical protein
MNLSKFYWYFACWIVVGWCGFCIQAADQSVEFELPQLRIRYSLPSPYDFKNPLKNDFVSTPRVFEKVEDLIVEAEEKFSRIEREIVEIQKRIDVSDRNPGWSPSPSKRLKSISTKQVFGIWVSIIEWDFCIDGPLPLHPLCVGVIKLANGDFIEPEFYLVDSVPMGSELFGPLSRSHSVEVEIGLKRKLKRNLQDLAGNDIAKLQDGLVLRLRNIAMKQSQVTLDVGDRKRLSFETFEDVYMCELIVSMGIEKTKRSLFFGREEFQRLRELSSTVDLD